MIYKEDMTKTGAMEGMEMEKREIIGYVANGEGTPCAVYVAEWTMNGKRMFTGGIERHFIGARDFATRAAAVRFIRRAAGI